MSVQSVWFSGFQILSFERFTQGPGFYFKSALKSVSSEEILFCFGRLGAGNKVNYLACVHVGLGSLGSGPGDPEIDSTACTECLILGKS